jgi:hypothetical protein
MAENNRRSYRDPPHWRSAEEASRDQVDDPLAELARLIGQSVPMNKLGREHRPVAADNVDEPRGQTDRAAGYATPEVLQESSDERYSASEDQGYERDVDPDYRARSDDPYEPTARVNPAPPSRASRSRREPDFAIESTSDALGHEDDRAAYQEAAEWHDPSSVERDDRYPHEYEDDAHDGGDHAYDDDGYGEDPDTGRRRGFVFVAAVFALAVLGTAGAFAYRTIFGGPTAPTLPPIIKAEAGPNKIMPSGGSSQDDTRRQADATSAGSRERLVSREERPVDIPPAVTSTAPRQVSTVPVFPDPPQLGGPGAVVGYSANPVSGNATASMEPPAPTPPATTTSIPPNPAPSGTQAGPPASATAASVAPGAAPAPKKIRTVTIRSDQSGAPDASASAGQAVPPRSGTPLSIVPSSTEASAPAARPRSAPAQPAPLKPSANEIASAAPVAPATGSYAVQVSSQRSEEEAQSSFRDLQAKYPNLLGGRAPIIRRADLGAKGIFFRAMVGPFASADEATTLCSNLKAAGGSCLVQKN